MSPSVEKRVRIWIVMSVWTKARVSVKVVREGRAWRAVLIIVSRE